ncbi:M41 family metallopeptidase [Neorhizobium galegae]|uniref:hypothetical protein n=1 Tax=Neorhizobium galegae TaxID=399 RepID=UPI0009B902E7
MACVHEAGHAVVGMSLGIGRPDLVTVQRFHSHRSGNTAFVSWIRNVRLQRSRESYLNEISMLLGGRAAEEVILGTMHDGSGGVMGSDLQRATDLATYMLAALGMGDGLSYSNASDSRELEKLRTSNAILHRRVPEPAALESTRHGKKHDDEPNSEPEPFIGQGKADGCRRCAYDIWCEPLDVSLDRCGLDCLPDGETCHQGKAASRSMPCGKHVLSFDRQCHD